MVKEAFVHKIIFLFSVIMGIMKPAKSQDLLFQQFVCRGIERQYILCNKQLRRHIPNPFCEFHAAKATNSLNNKVIHIPYAVLQRVWMTKITWKSQQHVRMTKKAIILGVCKQLSLKTFCCKCNGYSSFKENGNLTNKNTMKKEKLSSKARLIFFYLFDNANLKTSRKKLRRHQGRNVRGAYGPRPSPPQKKKK